MRRLVSVVSFLLVLSSAASARAAAGLDATFDVRAAQRVSARFFGMTVDQAFDRGVGTRRERTLDAVAASGVGSIRHRLDWARVEPEPGRFDFAQYDAWVASLARRGLTWLPILLEPPKWASTAPATGAERGAYPPRSLERWQRYVAAAVARYGTRGTFWREYPEVPRRPVRDWQVWNEPSLPVFWRPRPDPSAYAELLVASAEAIRSTDPRARVVGAALPESRLGAPLARFLDDVYRAGAGRAMDAVAVNGYARRPVGTIRLLERARRVMARHGDRHKPLWLSEFGWATIDSSARPLQARAVVQTMGAVVRARRRLHLAGAVHYMWQDIPSQPGMDDFWGMRTGLLDEAGRRKPAYTGFVRAIRELVR